MQFLDLTLPTLAENLALDEAILENAELSAQNAPDGATSELLRVWEAPSYGVVLGRSSSADVEVDREACRRLGIPIMRRCSGGATVVVGPGCLMYGVLLSIKQRPECQSIDAAHQLVMTHLMRAIGPHVENIHLSGICDLTMDGRKFSGNSLRCKRHHVLYHGTLLYGFDLAMLAGLLKHPAREPEYRHRRSHLEFVTNIEISPSDLRQGLQSVWSAQEAVSTWPIEKTLELVEARYSKDEWNFRH